jgi:hypothetical protein
MNPMECEELMRLLAQYWPSWSEKVRVKAPALCELWRQAFEQRDFADGKAALRRVAETTRFNSPTVNDFTTRYSAIHQRPEGQPLTPGAPKYSGWWIARRTVSGRWVAEALIWPNPKEEARLGAEAERIAKGWAARSQQLYGVQFYPVHQEPGNEAINPAMVWNAEEDAKAQASPA